MTGIVRAHRPSRGWFEVQNATARDVRLSFRARGILMRILSNDDGFRCTSDDLAREGKEGRGAILTCFKELRAAGYMVTRKWQDEKGHWHTETLVFDTPQESTGVGKPDAGSLDPIKEHHEKNHSLHATRAREGVGSSSPPVRACKKKSVEAGVLCWTGEDRLQVEEFVKTHGREQVEAAAMELAGQGVDPLPSYVLKILNGVRNGKRVGNSSTTEATIRAAIESSLQYYGLGHAAAGGEREVEGERVG